MPQEVYIVIYSDEYRGWWPDFKQQTAYTDKAKAEQRVADLNAEEDSYKDWQVLTYRLE